MIPARISLLGSMEEQLRHYLDSHPNGHERAAAVLFRRLHRRAEGLPDSDRFLGIELHPFEDHWITSSSPSHVAFDLRHLRELFRRCAEESLVFGFVHNHTGGLAQFSDVDEENERTLLKALTNRNGDDIHFVALLWSDRAWLARTRAAKVPTRSVLTR